MPRNVGAKGKGGKKIHKTILREERSMAKKVARKEVSKARRIVRRKGQWTVAAGALGYHAGYDSKEGFFGRKGHLYGRAGGGVASQPVGTYSIPASSSYVFRPYYTTKKGPRGGLIVCGTQNIGTIASLASPSSAAAFVIGGARTVLFYLNPDDIGGPMALDARKYNFFNFKKVKFIFPMNASSTDTQNMVIAYQPDPAISTFQTLTYDTLQQSTDLFVGSRKQLNGPIVMALTMLNKSQFKKYNTEVDTTDSMSIRACRQGAVYGLFDATDNTGLKYGDIVMEYELELYDRSPDYGFNVQISHLPVLRDEILPIFWKLRSLEEKKGPDQLADRLNALIPRFVTQQKQLENYIRRLGTSYSDPRLASMVTLVAPSISTSGAFGSGPVMIAGRKIHGNTDTVNGMVGGAMGDTAYLGSTDDLADARPLIAVPVEQGSVDTGCAMPLGAATGTLAPSTGVTALAELNDMRIMSTTTIGTVRNLPATSAAASDAKSGPILSAAVSKILENELKPVRPLPTGVGKTYSYNAKCQFGLIQRLAQMEPMERRKCMKDITTLAYQTIRDHWPPFVKEYDGIMRMVAQQMVEMAEAEARRQDDDSASSADDKSDDEVDFKALASDGYVILAKEPKKAFEVRYAELKVVLGPEDFQEYRKLLSLARIAQRSFASTDPTDTDRRKACGDAQRKIREFLSTCISRASVREAGPSNLK
jgi:hypothetical protein